MPFPGPVLVGKQEASRGYGGYKSLVVNLCTALRNRLSARSFPSDVADLKVLPLVIF